MANPVNVSTPEGVWTKVITNATVADIYVIRGGLQYVQTIRDTGDTAPDAADRLTEAYRLNDTKPTPLRSTVPRDVYVWCDGGDGIVRVDVS